MNSFWNAILKPKPWLAKVLLLGLLTAFLSLGFLGYLEPIANFLRSESFSFSVGELHFSAYLFFKLMLSVVTLIWITGIISEFGEKRIHGFKNIKSSNRALMAKGFQISLYFIAFLIALNVLGIDITAFAVVGGAVGVGIGFGLQKITSNFISGLILLVEKSVEEGDLIELDDGTSGYLRQTNARYSLIETFDNLEVMIPNEDLITKRVVNWTYSNTLCRIVLKIGVSYDTDLDLARSLIQESATEHPSCSKSIAPSCFLTGFGESSVDFTLHFWVDDVLNGLKGPQSDVLFSIWRRFKAHGIVIPYPQRDLHIKNPDALS